MLITLLGPNTFSKQRELRKLLAEKQHVDIDGGAGLSLWYQQLGQADLFGESSIIVGRELCEDLSKEEQRTLADYLITQNIAASDQTVIVVANDEKAFEVSPLKGVLQSGRVIAFPLPSLPKLHQWMQLEAERLGLTIDKAAIVELAARLNQNQFAILTELERLALQESPVVTKDMVLEIPPMGTELDNFALINSWVDKKVSRAIEQLGVLRRQGVADQAIMGIIAWKIESLLIQAYAGKSTGKWSKQQLEQAMMGLYQLDLQAKKGLAEFGPGLEMWLVETMGVGV